MNKTWFLFLVIIAGLQPNAQLTVVNQPVINTYAAATEVNFCQNTMRVASNADNNFSLGEKVLIVQMKAADLESQLIKSRLVSRYCNHIKNGREVGRKSGSIQLKDECIKKHTEVIKYLKKGYSYRHISVWTNNKSVS